jgi:hypothetical protein
MAAPAACKRHVAFEVHLPKLIGFRLLEAQVGRSAARRRCNPAVPLQDGMHRRLCRTGHSIAFKAARDFARTPGRVRIAHRKDAFLNRGLGPRRVRMRTARPVRQLFTGSPSLDPLVSGIRMNAEPPAQFATVHPFLHCQSNELAPLFHNRHLVPRHGWPPCSRFHAMLMCRSCPRTPVGGVSGLNNLGRA